MIIMIMTMIMIIIKIIMMMMMMMIIIIIHYNTVQKRLGKVPTIVLSAIISHHAYHWLTGFQ